ncbi:MAG TPA: hypothetical protein VKI65_14320, partial [Gemmataceae bacterium]|nr:hypothetical protein [Gemmataceae bacterium]
SWRDLLHKPSVEKLPDDALEQWREHFVTRKQRQEDLSAAQALDLGHALSMLTTEELRQMAQKEIDERWENNLAYRRRVGLWQDDFSNLLSVFREWGNR